jgi:hypothetical protein
VILVPRSLGIKLVLNLMTIILSSAQAVDTTAIFSPLIIHVYPVNGSFLLAQVVELLELLAQSVTILMWLKDQVPT